MDITGLFQHVVQMFSLAGAAGSSGFWSRRLEEADAGAAGAAPSADGLDAMSPHPKGHHHSPGPGPGPPYSGSYRKFVNHLVRSNFSDSLDDDSTFVGVDKPPVSEMDGEVSPPRPPPRAPRAAPRLSRPPSLASFSTLHEDADEGRLQGTAHPTTLPPTPERPPRLHAGRRGG
ncbi:uncharacterized protein LOC117643290 [Thrips palmi]|uniref:Uncharacterized protein LOC117643290 n=1 Tax=Thrips palmi TaxID=161013 RepID=A0A6P8YMA8_THRPL|nr:uncharacterized protein LOC117643290 [Thrips palmi]